MKYFSVLGNPINHSLSPKIFRIIFNELNIQAKYNARQIKTSNDLTKYIHNQKNKLSGFNVTLPYKEIIYNNMDTCDNISSIIKSINCVKIIKSRFIGFNTDYFGFLQLLQNNRINIKGKNLLILGNGGSARAIIYSLLKNYENDIFIWGRNSSKVTDLVEYMNSQLRVNRLHEYKNIKNHQWVVINCLTFNLDENSMNLIMQTLPLNNMELFIDINYFKTKIINNLEKNKFNVMMGKDMLIFQALESFNIWFNGKYSNKISYKKIKNKITE